MKILYFDCFSGISGDMAIGALLDLGIDREVFLKELSRLGLDGYRLEITTKTMNGIQGTDVNVMLTDKGQDHNHENDHGHEYDCGHNHDGHDHRDECSCGSEDEHIDDHGHEHSYSHEDHPGHEHSHSHEDDPGHEHSHSHEDDPGHDHDHVRNHDGHDHLHCSCEHPHDGNDHPHFGYDHPHDAHDHQHEHGHEYPHTHGERGLVEIEQIIERSGLSEKVKAFSKKVFREIAAAEAKVHGKTIYEVHFHEVGAIDSIVDVAGTAICLELLGAERVYSSALHDGKGFIECRHGIIPVPVPAVMEMLNGSGIPLIEEDIGTELVTPTGMGLIKCMSSGFGSRPPMLAEKTGYGLGKRDTGRLNALRVILAETYEEKEAVNGDEVIVLETNVDDTTAEILGYTMSKLLEAGALDAFYTPIYMKKNRPAYMLTALALPDQEDLLAQIILSQTSTLGIRTRPMKRYCMERKTVSVRTPYGDARIKVATLGGIQKASPEYEDCRKIAESAGLPLAKAYALVAAEAAKQYGL